MTTHVVDTMAELIKFLPKTLTFANGDSITVKWGDEMIDGEHGPVPYGSINRISGRRFVSSKSGQVVAYTEEQIDSIAYAAGTSVYQVTERDIDTVTSLTATVGGTPSTALTEDVDFEIHQSPDYSTNDAIRFIAGGTAPDDATNFTVTYEHKLIREDQKDRYMSTYRLFLNVGKSDGPGGYLPPNRAGEQALEALENFLSINQGKVLPGGIKVHAVEVVLGGFQSSTEGVYRMVLDLRLSRKRDLQGPSTQFIGKVNATQQLEP